MARKIGTPLDFQQNEARNLRAHILASAPGSPVSGQLYYDSGLNSLYFYNGSAWVSASGGTPADATTSSKGIVQLAGDLAGTAAAPTLSATKDANVKARANHTGTQLASTISDFDTQVRTSRLDQMAAPSASVSLNSQKVTNLLDGTAAGDAINKSQLDAAVAGLDPKASVRVAYSTQQTLTGAATSEGGVTPGVGERVLLMGQTAPAENGIWVVSAGAWARSTDADAWTELVSAFVFVEEGTNADNGYTCTVNAGGTLGTTAVTWVQFSGAGQITAGNGLAKTGNTLDVNVDNSSIEINADILRVKAGGITEAMLADNSVTLDDSQGTIAGTLALGNGGTGQTTAKTARETGLSAGGYYTSATHGAGTTITITQATHGLRSGRGIIVQTQDEASGDGRLDDFSVAANGDVTVTFSVSQSANSIRVTLIG